MSSAGSYFSAWLTRIYRKYDIVMNQTRFIPKDAEEQHLAAMQNMIEIADGVIYDGEREFDDLAGLTGDRPRHVL